MELPTRERVRWPFDELHEFEVDDRFDPVLGGRGLRVQRDTHRQRDEGQQKGACYHEKETLPWNERGISNGSTGDANSE